MRNLKSYELRQLWFDFFKERNHIIIDSASLIPENDPTVLFTTAGMHPLVPYLLGQKHPEGKRLADVQKCVRTNDIDEVGDVSHCTFFEMLGNWSLGDYFKKEMIRYSFDFLTSPKYLGIDIKDLAVSVFAGDDNAPKDTESAQEWEKCGIPKDKIFFLPKKNNWWGLSDTAGPCGPDTEMFIDRGVPKCSPECSPACDCGKYLEIWNDVFMQYNINNGKLEPLSQKNIDTGMGLERVICILQGKKSVYETDIFEKIIKSIEESSGKDYFDERYTKAFRIIADHIRTATFLIGDKNGVVPSNVDQGYVLRRLLRRAIRYGRILELKENSLTKIASAVIETYKDIYKELVVNQEKILSEIKREEERFEKTLSQGLREFEKLLTHFEGEVLDGKTAFRLYDTFGFPIEMTKELAAENNLSVDEEGYKAAYAEHQAKSQQGATQRFKGGLADAQEETTKLHTATHLLQAALRKVLGDTVFQRGSNITAERLRFDFSFERKMTPEEIKEVERLVNEAIAADMPIMCEEMTVDEAKKDGALGVFESKYGEKVKVYTMGDFSKEICGGPHAKSTGELKGFKIQKEESSSSGVRRIKAIIG